MDKRKPRYHARNGVQLQADTVAWDPEEKIENSDASEV